MSPSNHDWTHNGFPMGSHAAHRALGWPIRNTPAHLSCLIDAIWWTADTSWRASLKSGEGGCDRWGTASARGRGWGGPVGAPAMTTIAFPASTSNKHHQRDPRPILHTFGMDSHHRQMGIWIGDCKADGLQNLTILCAKIKERWFRPIGSKYERKFECWSVKPFWKTFFTNGLVWKHILDLDPFKDVRLAGILIKLRNAKGFSTIPSTSEIKIKGRQSYWRPIWIEGCHSCCRLVLYMIYVI
jgi:hypothetical protein